ncbi:MAG TPA: 2-amino-4-hydroxy-6-hydroxymethyldihydropteridine diphosphokinase [Bacteroidia bacterium]|jgi:2-amino-4-hydroxy-6-hydroxymethyldihydropteridine diphosphokinase|nr:2-amino-4-hydroxy-6-hydroxymethyldihydropteridine diphosphokinase [Bacteroidia bacterium]
MNEAYLCLGGNLGNCIETFAKSALLLEENKVKITLKSAIYTSEAWGMGNAPDFYNQVLKTETLLEAGELLSVILSIEKQLGRERNSAKEYESRTIDIDILFFNEQIMEEERLQIPHPRLHLRRFVLEPLHEIAPDFIHPGFKKSISALLNECTDAGVVKKISHGL